MTRSFTIQMYRCLYENKALELYRWHQTTCISPIELAAIVNEELGKGRILLSDDKTSISLSDYGRKWIETNRLDLFAEEKKPWKDVPENMYNNGDDLFDSFFNTNDLQRLIDNLKY